VKKWIASLVLLVVATLSPAWAAAAEPISIGYFRGSSEVPIPLLQARAEKAGVDVQPKGFVQIDALDRAFILKEFDVHMALSLNTWGNYLQQGHDLVGIMGTLYPNGYVVVKKDAPYRSLADLKGKRLGVYGIHNTSTAMLGVIAGQQAGMDIRKDMQLFGSAAPALPTLLAKGELDAILNLPPFVPRMLASGEYRILLDISEEWKKLTGHGIPFSVMVVRRETLEKKTDAVRAVVQAWRAAVDDIKQRPDRMNEYLAKAKMTEPAAVKIAQQIMIPQFMNTWTEKEVENVRLYWKIAAERGFLEKPVMAEHWFSLDLAR
jgi:NitT/TauT family transport system substrate-binding protein